MRDSDSDQHHLHQAAASSIMPTLLGSASASLVSRLVTHPLDTVKARLQATYPAGSPVGSTASAAAIMSNQTSLPGSSSTSSNHIKSTTTAARGGGGGISYAYRGPWDVLKRTIQGEGFWALYRGFGAVIYGGTPATVLYLSTYEISKTRLTEIMCSSVSNDNSNNDNDSTTTTRSKEVGGGNLSDFVIHFGSGMLAEAVSCIVFVPVDVVKERLQVQHGDTIRTISASQQGGTTTSNSSSSSSSPKVACTLSTGGGTMAYKNSWDALSRISQTEGILALYKGYGATLLSFGTFSGLFFLLYERLLLQVRRHLSEQQQQQQQGLYYSVDKREVPFHWTLICSCSAGTVASWITSPLDMAKLRLQVQRGQLAAASASSSSATASTTSSTFQYRNVWHCLQHSYQTAGMRGLFRGAGARVLHFAPSTTVTMTSYETFRTFFARIFLAPDGGEHS